jgi:hypothetical protein
MSLNWSIDQRAVETDLPAAMSDYANVSRYERSAARTTLCVPAGRKVEPREVESNYPLGEHRARIAVVAENAAAVSAVISWVISWVTSHERWITDVKFADPPSSAVRVGILNLLRAAATSETDEADEPPTDNGDAHAGQPDDPNDQAP